MRKSFLNIPPTFKAIKTFTNDTLLTSSPCGMKINDFQSSHFPFTCKFTYKRSFFLNYDAILCVWSDGKCFNKILRIHRQTIPKINKPRASISESHKTACGFYGAFFYVFVFTLFFRKFTFEFSLETKVEAMRCEAAVPLLKLDDNSMMSTMGFEDLRFDDLSS